MAASPTDVFCARLQALVDTDSPSGGTEQEGVAEQLAAWLAPTGCMQTWVDEPDNPARSLVLTVPGDGGPAVALLGHPDTVFPPGRPRGGGSRATGDRCTGPGVADMKGGLVLAAMAMERLAALPAAAVLGAAPAGVRRRGGTPARAGRLRSRPRRRRRARVRVRPPQRRPRLGPQGRALAHAHLHGRAAHAGADTALGRSAVSALAREVLRIEGLTDGRPEMTSVITTVAGGDSANTRPRAGPGDDRHPLERRRRPRAGRRRARAAEPLRRRRARALRPRHLAADAGRSATCSRPRSATPAPLGLDIGSELSGGVSDGCWTGAWGIPTLDGLGPVGGDDHTEAEWIEVATLERRLELVVRLIQTACAVP